MTDRVMVQMADQTGMKALHMVTSGDPARNASFVFFGDPNYFLTDFPASTCTTCINPLFAWNHGDIQPEIATTWIGMVGPGVSHLGQTGRTWSDHADVRPTVLTLLGLKDTYVHDGRALVEVIQEYARPARLREAEGLLSEFADLFKQINAPFGSLALDSLKVSTAALSSNAPADSVYTVLQAKIAGWTARRDGLAGDMKALLDGATFHGRPFDGRRALQLTAEARALLTEVRRCAAHVSSCAK